MDQDKHLAHSEKLAYQQSSATNGEIEGQTETIHDAVFGEIGGDGPNYRSVGWIPTVVLLMKTQLGLGVLSIPAVFDSLGMIPGIICLLVIGGITTWSDYEVGVFKQNHPEVYGIDDVGRILFGRVGREFFVVALWCFLTFVAAAGMLSISIAFNALSLHGTCTAVFVAVAAIIAFSFASIRTLGRISWLAWVGLAGILISILVVTIAVGVQDRPAAAPQTGVYKSDFKIIGNPSFADASTALSSIVFAYAGTPAYFPILSEMRQPRDYTKAMLWAQGIVTLFYIVIGIVVYYYCGSFVASPALGSAGVLLKRVCYGLALPGLIVSTLLYTHLTAKSIFVRVLRNSKHLSANTFVHWGTWLGCTLGVTLIAYIIASAIPVFGGLVSLVGALFGTVMCFQPMGIMWLYDNWRGKSMGGTRWMLMACFSVFVIVSGSFLMVAGTYGSIVGIIDTYKASGGSAAWSCADNSNSVGTT